MLEYPSFPNRPKKEKSEFTPKQLFIELLVNEKIHSDDYNLELDILLQKSSVECQEKTMLYITLLNLDIELITSNLIKRRIVFLNAMLGIFKGVKAAKLTKADSYNLRHQLILEINKIIDQSKL